MKKLMLIAALAMSIGAVFLPSISDASVWSVKNRWSEEWEAKYSEWIKQNLSIHFFEKDGKPYSGLKLDCADVVYSLRVIFSAENNLPFLVGDKTGGKNSISNEMSRWDKLPEEQRLRQFLLYVMEMTGTETLPADTFPVAIDPKWIHSGTIIRTDHASHHSWTIQDVNDVGLPHLIFSSRPAKNTILEKIGYPSYGFTFPNGNSAKAKAGFRYFREPQYIGIPEWKVPGYSEDMFKLKPSDWPKAIQKTLAKNSEDTELRLQRLLKESCDYARDRVSAVNDALTYLQSLAANACMDAAKYDDYSTPNRDLRLQDLFKELDQAYTEAKGERANLSDAVVSAMKSVQVATGDTAENAFCPVEVAPGKNISLSQVRFRSYQGLLSNNPHDTLEYRWGFQAGHSPRAKKCPSY